LSIPFDGRAPFIFVGARVWGPNGELFIKLALDTGSTTTLISRSILEALGYRINDSTKRIRSTTASGELSAPIIEVARLRALRQERERFDVLCHTLPHVTGLDGLLGLDFLRDRRISIDFRAGRIAIE
jgi:predicted aspartyl protease